MSSSAPLPRTAVAAAPNLWPLAADAAPSYASVLHYAEAVLRTGDALEKARLCTEASELYKRGALAMFPSGDSPLPSPPSKPARPAHLTVVAPRELPPARKGVENHGFNKLRLLHSLAHIECFAIDLSMDMLLRFATRVPTDKEADLRSIEGPATTAGVALPLEFYEDWLRIAHEEAAHFLIWNKRLEELGEHYGFLPVHDELWQSAGDTSHSCMARLAVVHAVHEARGLDQTPRFLSQLQTYGDKRSHDLLELIEADELTHVSSGLRWFKYLCAHAKPQALADPVAEFHRIVRANFRGALLPPFNTESRSKAGFTPEWYLPLATKKEPKGPAVAPAAAEEEEKAEGGEKAAEEPASATADSGQASN